MADIFLSLGFWDILLIAVVSAQATVLAYVYHPRWKAFVLTLPVPFTVAVLAVGRPIDATNVLGLTLLLLFTHAVRLLYSEVHVPIVLSIVLAALGYCFVGWKLADVLPRDPALFWAACCATVALAVILLKIQPHRHEPGHRTTLPLWLKVPLIVLVVLFIVMMKKSLHGFMTMFPMVGVIGAYEARRSLWTISRQMPIIMLTMTALMMVCALAQNSLGLGPSLALGWLGFLILLPWLMRYTRATTEAADAVDAADYEVVGGSSGIAVAGQRS